MLSYNREASGARLTEGFRPYVLIAVMGLLLYSWSALFGFTHFDDNVLIGDNLEFLGKFRNVAAAFRQDVFHVLHQYSASYRPLLTVSFIIDAQLDRVIGSGYHLTNVLLHVILSCLVFRLFLELKYRRDLALVFAVVYTVHPVLTQSAVWIPGRNDSLLGIFVLAGFIFFVSYLRTGRLYRLAAYIIMFICALFTKESAIGLPVVSIAYYLFIFRGRIVSAKSVLLSLGVSASLVLYMILRHNALLIRPIRMTLVSILRDIALGSPAFFIYAGKSLLPFDMSVIPTIEDSAVIYGIAAAALGLLALYLSKNRKNGFALLGISWFIVFLAPTFVRSPGSISGIYLESRMCVPLVGIFIALGEIDPVKSVDLGKKGVRYALAAIISAFFLASLHYSLYFRSATSFWEAAVRKSPGLAMAKSSLGWIYYTRGRLAEARKLLEDAVWIDPRQRYAHNNLGCVYEALALKERAAKEYATEIKNTPYYDKAYINLARLCYANGEKDKAVTLWRKALEINPENTRVRELLDIAE